MDAGGILSCKNRKRGIIMKMLTPYDIAELLQVSYDTALEFIKNSGIQYIKVGKQYRVSEKVFHTFISPTQPKTVKLTQRNIYNNVNDSKKLRRK